jgi:hypothetical protein
MVLRLTKNQSNWRLSLSWTTSRRTGLGEKRQGGADETSVLFRRHSPAFAGRRLRAFWKRKPFNWAFLEPWPLVGQSLGSLIRKTNRPERPNEASVASAGTRSGAKKKPKKKLQTSETASVSR